MMQSCLSPISTLGVIPVHRLQIPNNNSFFGTQYIIYWHAGWQTLMCKISLAAFDCSLPCRDSSFMHTVTQAWLHRVGDAASCATVRCKCIRWDFTMQRLLLWFWHFRSMPWTDITPDVQLGNAWLKLHVQGSEPDLHLPRIAFMLRARFGNLPI